MVLMCLLLLSIPVYADVVGTWDIGGIAKFRVSMKGRSTGGNSPITEQLVFGPGPDNTFSMTDITDFFAEAHGTWGYVKKKFAIYFDSNYLETNLTNLLIETFRSEGYEVEIRNPAITKNTFNGKEKKDGTINGKWTLVYTAYIYITDIGIGANVKAKTTITFTGTRATSVDILGLESVQPEELSSENIKSIIMEEVCNGIQEVLLDTESIP
jgi:hypothetical protein